jgi:SAM-dependent methyltransferase
MPPEESGQRLLDLLQERLCLAGLASTRMLDFGCGVRFTQALLNRRLPIGQYAGVDCYPEMIEFLRTSVRDPRFSFELLDAHHPLYNPGGTRLTPSTPLALPLRHFDVATMFSVLTHQYPEDSRAILSILRRHVRSTGHLFFTCFLDPDLPEFEDRSPERDGGRCFYSEEFLSRLLRATGWAPVARYPAGPPLIGDAFLCCPV